MYIETLKDSVKSALKDIVQWQKAFEKIYAV